MGNSFGTLYRFTIFGQSHAPAIGVTIEGLPAGMEIDRGALSAFMARRAPGGGRYATARREADEPVFVSGLTPEGRTCGSPLTALIYNTDTRSGDYSELEFKPRPGHADLCAMLKYGAGRDFAGGGQFSGRLTAPLCVAGGLAKQLLSERGIEVSARICSIAGETDTDRMYAAIDAAREDGDSVGGIIECTVTGVPAGVGEPMFGGVENRISQAVFGIPAVKGIEFGAGFAAAAMRGSQCNDPFYYDGDVIKTHGNDHGGSLGGISSGMPIVFRAAIKPTPSISITQQTVNIKTHENTQLSVRGRHDPCIVPRALPCVEAAAAAAVYDMLLESK